MPDAGAGRKGLGASPNTTPRRFKERRRAVIEAPDCGSCRHAIQGALPRSAFADRCGVV